MTARESFGSGSHGGIVGGGGRGPMPGQRGGPVAPGTLDELVREARRRWASGVAVVTTREEAGFRGATVSAFVVVSLDPPRLLVCLDNEARMSALVPEVGAFAVSILDTAQEFLAERFAGRAPLPDARLTGIPHRLTASGCPLLVGALAGFDCRVAATHDGGDHLIVVGDILAAMAGDEGDDPLITYGGGYRTLEPA